MDIRILSREEVFSKPTWRFSVEVPSYFAMYSSLFGGIVKDPALMVIPVDDHMVHRGDGVFEAMKCVRGAIYNLDAHLLRLQESAKLASIAFPFEIEVIKRIILETVAAGGQEDCIVRVYVSRGLGGGLTCHPASCRSQLYVIACGEKGAPERFYTDGASAIISSITAKPGIFSRVKSCNYLPNALAHLEAYRRGADFAIILAADGYVSEGATESLAFVDKQRRFLYPRFDYSLKGTTLLRAVEACQEMVREGVLTAVLCKDISVSEVFNSEEVLVFGTRPGVGTDVIPVIKVEDRVIGSGKPGLIYTMLRNFFIKDVTENISLLTRVFK